MASHQGNQIGDDQTQEFTSTSADSQADVCKLTEELRIIKLQYDKMLEEKNVEVRHLKAQLEQKDDVITAVRTELTQVQKKYEQPTAAAARSNEMTESPLAVTHLNLQLPQMDNERSFHDENESSAAIEDYVIFPEELVEQIKLLSKNHGIDDDVEIFQDPHNWQKVIVLAPEATSKLTRPLQDLRRYNPQFAEFDVEPFDHDEEIMIQQFYWQSVFHLERKTITTGSATCELIVQTRTHPQRVFFVGPAHIMFTKEANEKFQTDQCNIKQIRDEIKEVLPTRTVAIRSDHATEVEIPPTPMIAYRYRYKRQTLPPNHHKLYTNDCALFEFDAAKAQDVQRALRDANVFRYEKLREVTTTDQLQVEHMRCLQIAVRGYTGRLYHAINIDQDIARCTGVHLTFVLTSKDQDGNYHTLSAGDSGSIVYFVGEKTDGRRIHMPWGMLVGSVRIPGLSSHLYTAIVLNQAFKDIEEDYALSTGEIQLYQVPDQYAATSAVNAKPVPSAPSSTTSMHSDQGATTTAQHSLKGPSSLPTMPCPSTEQASSTEPLPIGEDYSVSQKATSSASPDNSD